jgi:hypothetical protein
MATKSKLKKAARKSSKPAEAKKAAPIAKAPKKTLKKTRPSEFVVPVPSPAATGAIVRGTDPCTCGHAPEEHGRDAAYPGSTACTVDGCGCISYESNESDNWID